MCKQKDHLFTFVYSNAFFFDIVESSKGIVPSILYNPLLNYYQKISIDSIQFGVLLLSG